MNESLVIKNQFGWVTSSMLVAGKFEKEHFHVLRDIKTLMERMKKENPFLDAPPMFFESTYLSEQNKELPMYFMNRDGFTLLAMGFTGEPAFKFKWEFLQQFNAMEDFVLKTKEQQITLPDFTKPAIAARAWADEVEKKELALLEMHKAQCKLGENSGKIQIADALLHVNVNNMYSMTETAQTLRVYDNGESDKDQNTGRNRLMRSLVEAHIFMYGNIPYQKYIDKGYFKMKPIRHQYTETVTVLPFVTGKGLMWFQYIINIGKLKMI
jgi:Rha family phage regulatory protein